MKTTRYLFLMLLMTLVGMSAEAQQRNVLQVPDVTTQICNVQLPISIENTDEVVGAQFDLTLPNGVTAETTGVLANRSDGHIVTVSRLNSGAYRVLLHSSQNRPLRGQSGIVMYLPINIPESFEEGSEHSLSIANAVLGKATGENVLTEAIAGKIRISKLPDLTVNSISCDKQTVTPGDRIIASWQVKNIGEMPTIGGWSEQISLVSEDGTQTKLIATTHYDDAVNASGVVSRQAEITLPLLLGIEGQVRLQVRIVPDSNAGELASAQGNNTGTGANALSVSKMLSLEFFPKRIDENNGNPIALRLCRSGLWTSAETFNITATADTRVSIPATITIPANQSGAVVYFTISDNDVLDNDSIVNISVAGNGYPETTVPFLIDDNELPSLSVSASKTEINEGETFQLTVTLPYTLSRDVALNIISEQPKRFKHSASVIIPAGKTSATVDVTVVDNDEVDLQTSVAFKVSADKYQDGECLVMLNDNDLPAIDLELSPTTVSESAGPIAIVAKLRRLTNKDKRVTVQLSDNSDGDIYYSNNSVVLESGVEEVQFPMGVVDNTIVDGDRQVNITAAVYVSSCSCSVSGTSVGSMTKTIEIIDNDGPSLSIVSSQSTLLEDNEDGIMLTISRNTDTSKALTVNISSDYDAGLEYNHNVTIPVGENSVSVKVKALADSASDDDKTIVFTVENDNFSKGTCWVMLTDQTLPDAQITAISVSKSEVEVGSDIDVNVTISNTGAAVLPETTKIGVYTGNSASPIIYMYTQHSLAPGEQLTMSKSVTLPSTVGTYNIHAVANEGNAVKELLYVNNTSEKVTVKTTAPFKATVAVDKKTYQTGEEVKISGKVTGSGTSGTDVEVYVINDGLRQTIKTLADEDGNFSATFKPYSAQMGHFIVGACYPTEGLKDEMASFDIYGLKLASTSAITCETLLGEPYTGKISVVTPGVLPLTGMKVTVVSKPDNYDVNVTCPTSIEGGNTIFVDYSITGKGISQGNNWELVKIQLETNEGASVASTLYCYCRNPKGQLQADITAINTTMVKGSTRDYPITITNIGKGETGKITLSLPGWMSAATSAEMASLAPGASTTAILRFIPTDDMQLNVPVTGSIGINCENGDGIPLSYSIEPVSDTTGTLVVDVCDEYTYYTAEAPHVAGAQVLVKHPTTGAIVAQGLTNEKGLYSVELTEGYYAVSVTAERHESYTNNVLVDPNRKKNLVVNIGYTAITYNWTVEETEVEDEYKIVTKVVYETNVPVPCVVLGVPEKIDGDNMRAGESTLVYFTATNKGLITALNVTFEMPANTDEWLFEPLANVEPFDLAPQQTVVVPVRITRLKDDAARLAKSAMHRANIVQYFNNCMAVVKADYEAMCGDLLKNNTAAEKMAMKMCGIAATGATIYDALASLMGGFGGVSYGPRPSMPSDNGGGKKYHSSETTNVVSEKSFNMCDTCDAQKAEKLFDVLIGKTFLAPVNEGMNIAYDMRGKDREQQHVILTETGLKKLGDMISEMFKAFMDHKTNGVSGLVFELLDIIEVVEISGKECPRPTDNNDGGSKSAKRVADETDGRRGWQKEYDNAASDVVDYLNTIYNILTEVYGDKIWFSGEDVVEKQDFIGLIAQNKDASAEEIVAKRPQSVSYEQALALYNRLNDKDSDNAIDFDNVGELAEKGKEINENAVNAGYESIEDRFQHTYDVCVQNYQEKTSSVCASITLQFSQTMTMTRQAFRGTLTVFNGNEEKAMENVKLSLEIRDEDGVIATSKEFQINAESLKGFSGEQDLTSGWSLAANETGTATILFIPTKYAAMEADKKYSFGGTLTYVDPFTNLEVTRDLYPITLTVKPSPNLDLTYFMQRDIYGDDPLTTDVIEACKPAEFALVINNKGYGDATNVRMVTNQPEITENEKGLLVDFELLSSQLNGKDNTLALGGSVATEFGTIPAHSTTYAQWWLQSSLLGHFTEYDVKATHVTSYGNENLSLLDNVTIHELIHGFTVKADGDKPLRGFLVNDIADKDDMPDEVYFTDATQQGVYQAAGATIIKRSDTEYELKVNAGTAGWNYGSLFDPTYGKQKLVKVVRADGAEIDVDNFWQTDRTLRDGKDPLYEKRLHFVGNMSAGSETFYLTFEPKPELELEVESFTGVPEEGTVLKEQLTELTVKFNKPIKAESFTAEDLTVNCQGVALDASQIVIGQVNESEFKLTLNEVTLLDGYYVLTVQTAAIEDNEGLTGTKGKQAAWIQFVDGKVALKVAASPSEGGMVTPSSGQFDYNSDVTLKAVAAEGYDFICWKENDEIVSDTPEYDYHLSGIAEFTAIFTPKHYDVVIECDEAQGNVSNAASGIYDFGTSLQMIAVPQPDFVFTGWVINGEAVSDGGDTLFVTVDKALEIRAEFVRHVYHQDITMSYGWNWMSTYMGEPMDINEVIPYANRIVGQFDELILDPQYGMVGGIDAFLPGKAYKIEAKTTFTKSFTGHIYHSETSPISLRTGWNWIAYPYMERTLVGAVVANASEGDYIVTQTGFAEYADGYWEGTLDLFEPGMGYLYKSTTDKDLVFDFTSVNTLESNARKSIKAVITDEEVDVHRYPNTMNLTVRLYKDGMELTEGNYLVYAMANDELRGISQHIGSNHYITVYGDEPVDITFICESTETGRTYVANETLQFRDDVIGSRKSPYAITFGNVTGIEQLDYEQEPIAVYSLEGILIGRNMTLKMLRKLPKGIYIINGQKCYVK